VAEKHADVIMKGTVMNRISMTMAAVGIGLFLSGVGLIGAETEKAKPDAKEATVSVGIFSYNRVFNNSWRTGQFNDNVVVWQKKIDDANKAKNESLERAMRLEYDIARGRLENDIPRDIEAALKKLGEEKKLLLILRAGTEIAWKRPDIREVDLTTDLIKIVKTKPKTQPEANPETKPAE